MKLTLGVLIFALFVLGALCLAALAFAPAHAQSAASPVMPIGKIVQIKTPLGLPPVPIPADNPPTEETIALGRRLYYDPALSQSMARSLARLATLRNLRSPTIVPYPRASARKPARATLPRSSIPPISQRNSGMAALPAWKSKPKGRWPIPWKWLIPSTAW